MKRQVIALMDSDESYAVRFMDYVNHRKNTPFEVRAFTDYGQMKQWISEHYAEILLISEDDFRKEDREIAGRAGVTVRLTGGPGGSGDQEPCICKYQAASAVLKEAAVIFSAGAHAEPEGSAGILKPRTKVAGVFSPVGRCGKTMFSLALAALLSETKPALYLNFESCPALPEELTEGAEYDFGDILYYLRQNSGGLGARMTAAAAERSGICLIAPGPSPGELGGVSSAEWERLFRVLRNETHYEAVVADLGDLPFIRPEILEECDEIYMPAAEDEISGRKMRLFLERGPDRDALFGERIHRLRFPRTEENRCAPGFMRRLRGSVYTRAAAECVREDGL